jgi:filamentous hemagglutinin family protein
MLNGVCYAKLIAIGLFSTMGLATPGLAQVVPDGTLGADSSRFTPNLVIRGGNADRIDGGVRQGGNLFHSFSSFNIGDGQRLYFANPTGIETIFTRVTGNTLSSINGTLGVDGAASLFLLNPNGILFGQNARLDLQGSFVGTTANSIRFGDQGTFSATNPQTVPLLTIQPSALVFTQVNSGKIVSESIAPAGQSPTGRNLLGLRVPDGQNMLLIGGDVEIDGNGIYSGLNAQGGRIELGGLVSAGEVAFNNFQLVYPIETARSNVSLSNAARVSTVGIGGGTLVVNANQLTTKTGAVVVAGTEGAGDSGDIIVNANVVNVIEIKSFDTPNGFYNQVRNAAATGNAGNITINANELMISDQAIFNTGTLGRGKGGSVNINARNTVTLDEGYIIAPVTSGANAQGGDVRIKAGSVVIKNGSQVDLSGSGQGNTGNVIIDARDRIEIESFGTAGSAIFNGIDAGGIGQTGEIRLTTGSLSLLGSAQLSGSISGQGNAGNITINARDEILIDAASISENGAKIGSDIKEGAIGKGGEVRLTTRLLSLKNGAQLTASTEGLGDSGNITVNAQDILFQGSATMPDGNRNRSGVFASVEQSGVGNAGDVRIVTNSLVLQEGASIFKLTRGQGNAGNVSIQASDRLEIADSFIFTSVSKDGIGNGGNIKIRAGKFAATGQSFLFSDTDGTGTAGDILIDANEFMASTVGLGGPTISTQTGGLGNSGDIIINVRDTISLNDSSIRSGVLDSGTINSKFKGRGQGGNIQITARALKLLNDAVIDSSTSGAGKAGDLVINVQENLLLDNSNIFTSTSSFDGSAAIGDAGNIKIDTGALILTNDSSISSATSAVKGNAGSIDILARDQITLDSSTLTTAVLSSTVAGKGGDIRLKTQSLSLANKALLFTASFGQGDAGSISIDARDRVSISGNAGLLASTAGQGNAGNITLRTGELFISGNNRSNGIFSTASKNSSGRGGDVNIAANSILAIDKATISAFTTGSGRAGDVKIQARDRIRLSSGSSILTSSIGTGQGGDVDIRSGILSLNQSSILADTLSANGGNVSLNLDILSMRNKSAISTNAGTAQAGGNGGDITINTSAIVAPARENSDISANAFTGRGGNVLINADAIFGIKARSKPTPESDITASSDRGVQGTIAITQPDTSPEQGLIQLPSNIIDASNQIGQSCPNASNNRNIGRFVVSGRGSLPSNPLDRIADNPNLPPLAQLPQGDRAMIQTIPPVRIVEAQGWQKSTDGKVVLIAQSVPKFASVGSCPPSKIYSALETTH